MVGGERNSGVADLCIWKSDEMALARSGSARLTPYMRWVFDIRHCWRFITYGTLICLLNHFDAEIRIEVLAHTLPKICVFRSTSSVSAFTEEVSFVILVRSERAPFLATSLPSHTGCVALWQCTPAPHGRGWGKTVDRRVIDMGSALGSFTTMISR